MGIIFRNGRPRLQRSIRRDGRVTTEYVGSGDFALLKHLLDADDREERAEQREQERAERQAADDIERALDDLAIQARALAHAALEAAGYHQHKQGEWRKKRGNRHRESRDGWASHGPLGS